MRNYPRQASFSPTLSGTLDLSTQAQLGERGAIHRVLHDFLVEVLHPGPDRRVSRGDLRCRLDRVGANNPLSGNFALPGSWAQNDLAIFWWYSRINTKTSPTPRAEYHRSYNNAATNGVIFIGYRVLQAGDVATNMDWTSITIASASVAYGTLILRGVDRTTPIEANSGTPALSTIRKARRPHGHRRHGGGLCRHDLRQEQRLHHDHGAGQLHVGGSAEDALGTDGSGGSAYRLNVAWDGRSGRWTLGG